MDKDAQMIAVMSNALINLQVKYRSSNITDRMQIRPELEKLLNRFSNYQKLLLQEGTISTDTDLSEMETIKSEIDKAANKQQLLAAIAKTISFLITKI